MSRTIHSGPLTFIDLTDTKKVDVHIASNLPTIQIFNSNNNTCSPDWSSTQLILTLTAYADSTNITSNLTSINWLRQIGTADPVVIQDSGETLHIAQNELIDENIARTAGVIAYICRVQYNNNKFENKITFARTDTGVNGTDGTSITIKGVAYCDTTLTDDDIGTEVSLKDEDNYSITAEEDGDSYVVQGYLCSYVADRTSFICVGKLQGQKGEDAKNIILTGTSQVFKVNANGDVSPETITVVATKINFSGEITWSYCCDGDTEFTTTEPNGVSREDDRITIAGNDIDDYVSAITIKATNGEIEDIFTVYKSIDGVTGDKGEDASIAFLTNENTSFHADSNGVVPSSTIFQTNVVAYTGTTKVTPVLGEIIDLPEGVSVVPNKGTAYVDGELSDTIETIYTDATKTTLVDIEALIDGDSFIIGDYLYKYDAINGCFKTDVVIVEEENENGETEEVYYFDRIVTDNEVTLLFTVAQNSNPPSNDVITVPVIAPVNTNLLLSYSKINAGAKGEDGVGIAGVSVKYGTTSTLSSDPETDVEWDDALPDTVNDGDYLWTRTQIDYTDATKEDTITYTYAKQGSQGESGSSISVVEISYCAHDSSTTPPETWNDTIVETTVDAPYLWTKTAFSDGEVAYSVARQGFTGQDGSNGQTSYLHIKYADVANPTTEQMNDIGGIYLGQYTDFNSTDSTDPHSYTWTRIKGDQGVQGQKGNDGVGIASTTITYGTSGSSSTQPTSWQNEIPTVADGQYLWTRTIIDYTDTSKTDTVSYTYAKQGEKGETGSAGSSVTITSIQYQEGSSATAAPNGSWSNSVVSVDDGKYLWTKTVFSDGQTSYGVAKQGSSGRGISSVTEYYLATSSSSGVTTSSSEWTTDIQTITSTKKYLWNYEVITYTDETTSSTTPIIIGVFGNTGGTGAAGKGIKSVTEYYLATSDSSGITTSTTGWQTTMQPLTSTNKYLWNCEVITYTDNSTATVDPVIIGVYGDKGDKGNQGDRGAGINSVTVTYGTSTSASTQPTSWQSAIPTVAEGSYLWTRTITDYTDTSIADTVTYTYAKQGVKGDTGSSGTSVTVSSIQYKEGSSATTAPTGTWSNSVVAVAEGSYLWTKTTFSDGKIAYGVAKQGAKGSQGIPAVTFQIYAQNGYLLTMDNPSLTLQTLAYEGSVAITSGATFKWYSWTEGAWTVISGATSSSLSVSKTDVLKSRSYKCEMTYKNNVYTSTATVEDKTDIYNSLIHATSKYSSTNRLYWVLYSIVYSEEGERDELLGPIDTTAPSNPVTGEYWYKVDETNYTVTLMKYSGTAWTTTTDKQELVYDWFLLNDVDNMITLGAQNKVKIVTANDFSRTCSVQCNVSDAELILLTQNNQILTDPSDPIISATEPVNPINGQLWIKTNTNGSYTLLVWDSSMGQWVVSEADTQNKIYVTKPTQYNTGDLWIVDSNYQPVAYDNGVVQTYKHPEKTMLRATATSQTYSDAHWVEALKYQKELDDVIEDVGKFKQFLSIDDTGLIMQAKGANGTVSEFKTVLTNTELGFYQGASRVAYINNNQLNISKAEITNGMTISGTTPELTIGNFVLIQESNGSLSIGLKS
jgi:hypothetical protein